MYRMGSLGLKQMSLQHQFDLLALRDGLESAGLNMLSVFDASYVREQLPDQFIPANCNSVLLLGNAGPSMWQALPEDCLTQDDPVDDFAVAVIQRLLSRQLAEESWQVLFPQSTVGSSLQLQKFGELAGWHFASPLGIGIHRRFGLWFAYRALVALQVEVAVHTGSHVSVAGGAEDGEAVSENKYHESSPCLSCDGTPCISACPAQALSVGRSPDLSACISHRSHPGSGCASTCVARLACPIATHWQYPPSQIAYYYDRSLASAIRWVDGS